MVVEVVAGNGDAVVALKGVCGGGSSVVCCATSGECPSMN
jgi:hypothetical protein